MPGKIDKGKLLDAILSSGLPIGLFIVDGDMRIIEFNQAAESLTGWKRVEVLGRQCSEMLKSDLCGDNCPLKKSAAANKAFIGEKATILSKWGENIQIYFTSSAVLDDDGNMIAGLEIFKDGTEHASIEALRKNFIAVFTHDLKHPVALIGAFLNRLIMGKAGDLDAKQLEYIKVAHEENQKLNTIILGFLEAMKLQAGELPLNRNPHALTNILDDLVKNFQVIAVEKGITLELELPESLPDILLDQSYLERALNNYLDNAIKYSPSGTRVMVRAYEETDYLVIEVRDQGAGISREELPNVFEYFYRSSSGRGEASGIGLGLASTKGIVEAHGGRVWVRSEEGKGSSFFMKFPKG